MKTLLRIFVVAASLCSAVFAQDASISGSVTDSSTTPIAKVAIKLTNNGTGISQEALTNDEGVFRFPSASPGVYSVTANISGFAPFRLADLRLEVGESRQVRIEMKPASVTESVNVTADVTPLVTNNADRSQLVENKFVLSIPLNVRNPLQMLNYTVGITPSNRSSGMNTSSQTQTNTFRINGAKASTTDILLDGAANTTTYANQAVAIPQVDAVQEFRTYTSAYSAEYGRTSGGMALFGLRSGSNEYHGTVHEFLRNSQLDANGFNANRAGVPRQSFQRNQFGFTLGGPVEIPKLYDGHNKTFLFLAYEGLRERAAGSYVGTVPTALERAGDFSQSRDVNGTLIAIYDPRTTRLDPNRPAGTTQYIRDLFPGNRIPQGDQSALAKGILNYYPMPNQRGQGLSSTNNFFSSDPTRNRQDRVDAKLDQYIGEKHRVFVRWNYFQNLNIYNDPFQNNVSPVPGDNRLPGKALMGQHTWTLSPTTLLEHHFSFAQHQSNRTSRNLGFDPSLLGIDPKAVDGNTLSFPLTTINRLASLGTSAGIFERNQSRVWQYQATLSWMRGRHSVKAGVDTRYYSLRLSSPPQPTLRLTSNFTGGPNPSAALAASGEGLADLFLNAGSYSNGVALADISNRRYHAVFAQDEIRLTPKLTVTLGLRYNLELGDREQNGHYPYLDIGSSSPITSEVPSIPNLRGGLHYVGAGESLQEAQKLNFDPRVGLAWQADSKTVVRAGFGIFHHPAPSIVGAVTSYGFSQTTNSVATLADTVTPLFNLANPLPNGLLPPTGNKLGLSTNLGQNISAVLRSQNVSYQANWSIDIQRQLPQHFVVTLGYSANSGVNLLTPVNLNQLPDSALAMGSGLLASVPNPFYGVITDATSLLSRPTVQQGQLLRPYPEFQNVTAQVTGAGHSSYQAAQLTVERRYQNGLSVLFAYTHSKTIDNVGEAGIWVGDASGFQNNNCYSCDRSLSLQDVPDSVRFSARYELPFGPGKTWMKSGIGSRVLGGWAIASFYTFDSGTPLRLSSPNDSSSFGGGTNMRPIATGVSPVLDGGPQIVDGGQYFNPAAFSRTPAFQFGNASRTIPGLRTPASFNWDALVEKQTAINEQIRLTFRMEMFNAANLLNFNGPGTNIATADFGRIFLQQANTPRQIQFGLRLAF